MPPCPQVGRVQTPWAIHPPKSPTSDCLEPQAAPSSPHQWCGELSLSLTLPGSAYLAPPTPHTGALSPEVFTLALPDLLGSPLTSAT